MDIRINEDELRLLLALREHCKRFNEQGLICPEPLMKYLGVDAQSLGRSASFLDGFKLVVLDFPVSSSSDGYHCLFNGLALTSAGESYLRAIDDAPGVGRRLTLATLKVVRDAALSAARIALTEWVKFMMTGNQKP